MDFTPTEEQEAAGELAAQIFADLSTHERLTAAGTGTDAELWKALGAAGLVAAAEETGLLGLVLLLEEQGRRTAQVPLTATCVYGLLAVAAHGTDEQRERLLPGLRDGTAVATGAFPAYGGVRADAEGRLSGTVPLVPWLRDATLVLVADRDRRLWLVRVADARTEAVETTAPWSAGRLILTGTRAEPLGGPGAYEQVLATARIACAGLQAGVCAGSLAQAVSYTSEREQFGRPLSTNQGVLLRAADAYMDTEAIRVTAYEAAWRHDEGLPYATHALTAAWWASEAGKRVVHAGQHLHGGLGSDIEHPVHRHFLWGRQLDAYLGCGSEVLEELGGLIVGAEEPRTEEMEEPV
ncbi:acyl-CoA dehydrogenase family protein [Streptomyces sp. NBC_01267]|uniref:acyl-CoA dehydrogenase family protein n=1 Tax=unclassified Streptomyces TaxID=2593676 RepID=UPI0022562606|nr:MULTISPECIES: acyl-CoA dehydrogenase family protein [unclassified Streptomyces]MCX4549442.1 acyl-CoA dehydrogenase family protein [Streptomyces sp. NBC_01500]WSC20997.1 acyl-CoA dehydrogenase family protein [Streptomyces sp. NBC_01766]WSV54983.1 acyl-CoA dehydrogenase family protein [Streptomyces sp. NBC_01014]